MRQIFIRLNESRFCGQYRGSTEFFRFNIGAHITIVGFTFFEALDELTANVIWPLGSVYIAIFAGWLMNQQIIHEQLMGKEEKLYHFWLISMRYLTPLAILGITFRVIGV